LASSIAPEPPLPASVAVDTTQPKLAQVAPLPRPKPSARAGVESTATYQVQLVAVRARDQALVMWENLLGKHQDVLGNLDPDISSRRMRNRNLVYRLRAGPIDSRSEASALCTTLSKRKVDCLVVRASG
jgi:cell division septation protein DedD